MHLASLALRYVFKMRTTLFSQEKGLMIRGAIRTVEGFFCTHVSSQSFFSFFLAESSSPPPPAPRPIPGQNIRGVDLLGNAPATSGSDFSTPPCASSVPWYDNSSLRPQLQPSTRRLPATQKTVSPAADNEVGGCMGPIYEDIDRMCSYRGYPPDSYYNLSGGSSPRNKSSNR